MPIYLCIACGLFHAAMAKLNSCDRETVCPANDPAMDTHMYFLVHTNECFSAVAISF